VVRGVTPCTVARGRLLVETGCYKGAKLNADTVVSSMAQQLIGAVRVQALCAALAAGGAPAGLQAQPPANQIWWSAVCGRVAAVHAGQQAGCCGINANSTMCLLMHNSSLRTAICSQAGAALSRDNPMWVWCTLLPSGDSSRVWKVCTGWVADTAGSRLGMPPALQPEAMLVGHVRGYCMLCQHQFLLFSCWRIVQQYLAVDQCPPHKLA
jgi:hypothetical protein